MAAVPADAEAFRLARGVHHRGRLLLQAGNDLVSVGLRQVAIRHRRVQTLRRRGYERVDELVDGLSLVLGDLRERLAAHERRTQLRLAEAEEGCGGVEVAAPVMAEATERGARTVEAGADEQRERGRGDAALHGVALLLCQQAVRHGGVDPVLQRLLECVAELGRVDAKLLGRIVHDCLALSLRRLAVGCHGGAGARDRKGRTGAGCDLRPLLHGLLLRVVSGSHCSTLV